VVKEVFKDIEIHDGFGLNLTGYSGYPEVKKILTCGYGGGISS
jgi:hypothetical protein